MSKADTAKKILKGMAVGVPSAAAGAGAGYIIGARRGVAQTGKAFEEYNKQENQAIANEFYNRGAGDALMSKAASFLENVKQDAFADELEKIALPTQAISALHKGIANTATGGLLGRAARKGREIYTDIKPFVKKHPVAVGAGVGTAAVGGSFLAGRASRGD